MNPEHEDPAMRDHDDEIAERLDLPNPLRIPLTAMERAVLERAAARLAARLAAKDEPITAAIAADGA